MGEIIREWLRTRLGVMIDLSPEIFGHYARDGTLLGKVLHSYDVINDSQLSTLAATQDPALARVNLKNLGVWLRFIGVDCENECIEDISNGKGTTALRLFYKVFLCLENKDRLHFVTLRKEREKYIPSSSKFDVTRVPEEEPDAKRSSVRMYAETLMKSASLIDWQKKKYEELKEGYKKSRERFDASRLDVEIAESPSSLVEERKGQRAKRVEFRLDETEIEELDRFSRKHRVVEEKKADEMEETKLVDTCETITEAEHPSGIAHKPDPEAAKAYTESLKSKSRQKAMTKNFKNRMRKNLLSDLWNKVLDDQEQEFDEIIAKKVLHQSQYEKRLMRKLCEVRSEKSRMAGNRLIVEKLLEETRESETRLEQERSREVMIREREEVEDEARRIEELQRRIEEASRQRRIEKRRRYLEGTVHDLVDIAARMAEYKATSYEGRVPDALLDRWKALFLKGQPIAEDGEELSVPDDAEEEIAREDDEEPEEDEARTGVLNDQDFENYHKIETPWKDFMPELDAETERYLNLGLLVLGYIVHKTLAIDSHQNVESDRSPLPPMGTRAVILGVPDALLHEPIQQLLKGRKIRLVRLEDAINHCLSRYKEEMRDFEYIDLEIVAATRQALASSSLASDETGPRARAKKSSKPRTVTSFERTEQPSARNKLDKITQTPRVIPHEDVDPRLSNAAYTGKWIHEFFSLGEPLTDELVSRTILEYLRSLEDVEGFVIVDYPNTGRQLASLEFALSGQRLSDDRVLSSSTSEYTIIEEADTIHPRIRFDEDEFESVSTWQRSGLVPDPIKAPYSTPKTVLTSFVRIKPKGESGKAVAVSDDDDDIWEILRDDATSVDAFYVDREIASVLYYTIFDLTTLKRLARLVIAGTDGKLARATSRELFGDYYLDYFEERREDDGYSARKAPIVKKLLRWNSSAESRSCESVETRQSSEVGAVESRDPLPGETEWSWADYPQPVQFLRSLAHLWRNLETRYTDNLKEAFHLKRMCFDEIAPYKDRARRQLREYIERPDNRQDALHEFHCAFNDIPSDIRDEAPVKEELHCRIDDFQSKLWDLCDERRRETEAEIRRIIDDRWTTRQIANLTNIYLDILQAEYERSNDSLQFLQDYYASMLQRPLEDIRSDVILRRIDLGISSPEPTNGSGDVQGNIGHSQLSRSPLPPDENLLQEETRRILTGEENCVIAETLCCRYLETSIQHTRSILEELASRRLDDLTREESAAIESPIPPRGERSTGNADTRRTRARNVFLEWRYALMHEINRIRLRLSILESAARSDLDYLIGTMSRTFVEARQSLTDRYERETRSVKDLTWIFRLATEQAIPIQEETLLDGDRFLVRSNVLVYPDEDIPIRAIREELLPSRFTIDQLSRLADLFARLAPSGRLSERSLVYVLQDLIVCDEDKYANPSLPYRWYELRACDVSRLIAESFGRAETLDWREFIIRAMDLVPPTIVQLVEDFRALRKIDRESREFVGRQHFLETELWFCRGVASEDSQPEDESEMSRLRMLKHLLCRVFSYDDERVNYVALLVAFCKDEKPEIGLAKALSLATGSRVCTDWEEAEEHAGRTSMVENYEGESEGTESEHTVEIRRSVSIHVPEDIVQSSLKESVHSAEESLDSDSIPADSATRVSKKSSIALPQTERLETSYRPESCVYWLSTRVIQTVLAAMLPTHASQSNLLQSGKTLYENLRLVCDELQEQAINGEEADSRVPAHRFLSHHFVKKLLADTCQFTNKRLDDIVYAIIRDNS